MPQIPVYDVPQSDQRLNVPEGGAATVAQAARRVGSLGQETAAGWQQGFGALAKGVGEFGQEIDATQTAHESSQILPKLALDQAQRMQDINSIAEGTNPNDVTTRLNQYKAEVLDPAKDEFLNGFSTKRSRQMASDAWGKYEANLYHHAAAVSLQASDDAQRTNLTLGTNQLIANVAKDPSLLDHNLDLADAAIQGASPALKGSLTKFSQTTKQELVASAIKSMAETNPDGAQAMLSSGKYDQYIGGHFDTLSRYVDTATRLHANDAERTARNQAADAKRASQEQSNDYLSRFTTDPTTGAVTTPSTFNVDVLKDNKLDAADKRTLIEFGQRMDANAGKEVRSTPGLLNEFTQRLSLPQGDPNRPSNPEILGHIGKDLSLTDGRFLLQQNQVHTPNDRLGNNQVALGYKMLDGFFNNPTVADTPEKAAAAKLNVDRAHAWFNTAIQAGTDRGLTLLQLTSPGSPDYVLGKVDPATGIPEGLANIPGIVGNPYSSPPPGTDAKTWGDTLRGLWHSFTAPSNEAPIPDQHSSVEPHEGASSNVAYNNFANMRAPGSMSLWQSFASPAAGIQAIENQLQRYASRGVGTVSQIVSTWAPPSENPTDRLVAQAARRMGVSPNTPIDLSDPQARTRMVAALIMQEHGYIPPRAAAVLGERLNG